MMCPNCKATDHESGAKYCHKCGSPLMSNNDSSRERPKPQDRYSTSSAPVGVEAVDLGLPSGTRWANMNVGATRPEEFGAYFAWGEKEDRATYDWDSYTHWDVDEESCHDLGSDIAGTRYDVAHVKWGDSWVMPSRAQIKELLDNCTSEWITLNGVKGMRFTGKNGGSIFLPAAGYRWSDDLNDAGSNGYYWSSTQSLDYSIFAYCLYFLSGSAYCWDGNRNNGHLVRPVSK